MMRNLHCLITALAYCSLTCARGDDGAVRTVRADPGEPLILNFGYSSPTIGASYDMTLDGKEIVVDNTRTFKQLDKLYFTEVYEHDSGEYRLTVTKDGVGFENKIILYG